MTNIRVAIIGWGNVGRYCKYVIENTIDMELAGVIRRETSLKNFDEELNGVNVASDISELSNVDVAIVCVPSRVAGDKVAQILKKGISTIDSFDIHSEIIETKKRLDKIAKQNKAVSILGAGWDPGSDSVIRCLMKMVNPHALASTTFGGSKGGRSMGHTVAVKSISGVKDAVALTLPNGAGQQKRLVYLELEKGADFNNIAEQIRQDDYFKSDPTDVIAVKDVAQYDTLNHGVEIEQRSEDVFQKYKLEGINPLMTANVLISAARAAYRATEQGQYGAYTIIERPLVDFIPGSLEDQLKEY